VIQVKSDFDLRQLNTFGVHAFAKAYIPISTIGQLKEALLYTEGEEPFILGGGSNILFLQNIDRPVIHVLIKGINSTQVGNQVILECGAGENWHEIVQYCVNNHLGGIENLSLIPGNIGTAPIQNIGAYGTELKDVFHSCEVMDRVTCKTQHLSAEDCQFGYRDSIFKTSAKNKFIITSVKLRLHDLSKSGSYEFNTNYGAIESELNRLGLEKSLKNVSQAVINIRRSKLPDPKVIGNGGSFFKNPIIEKSQYNRLLDRFPDLPSYPAEAGKVKVPAGYLIDHCGFKGHRKGDAGVHDKQALVLVNYGRASGSDIVELSKEIQQKVFDKYGIEIEPEVNLVL
jgi:UDP-N-acetylmuramate dehydrogenase